MTPPKKSLSTRRAKGASHLGIPTSRRASLKAPASAKIVTPPPKNSPASTTASPRVRPRSTRRQSLAVADNKLSPSLKSDDSSTHDYYATRKLSSSAYSSSSRKNSLVEETNADKDKGIIYHYYYYYICINMAMNG